ncbi:hypothetical protein SH1V18_00310 [Vallitalea longa]|uniref:Uncharacterized protein n=1 Tax=Vallitalea longa TaxID=2936439 RepID=A0A9W5Y841_9FIRM|nr:hypothetical protein [Vallitalea longa]GKX27551.1 hypothetical protein SH1V18_00310 [Vallitalea longa]
MSKHFVFQKDDMYYDIDYKSMDADGNVTGELTESELTKMIESLDDVQNIKASYEKTLNNEN